MIADKFGIDKALVIEESNYEIGELEFMKSLVVRFGKTLPSDDLPYPLAQLRNHAEQCAAITPVASIREEALFVVKWCDKMGGQFIICSGIVNLAT